MELLTIEGEAWEVKLEPTELQDSSWLGNLKYDYDSSAISQEGERSLFMHNGAPCHKARSIMAWLSDHNIPVLEQVGQSCNMNPIKPFRHNSNGISSSNSKVGMQGFVKVQNCSVIDVWQVSKLNWE